MKIPLLYIYLAITLILCYFLINISIENFDLVMIESQLNSNKYKVQDRFDKKIAADKMAEINKTIRSIQKVLVHSHPNDKRVIRMNKRLNNTKLQETINKPDESSYTINKGEIISFCLRNKDHEKRETDEFHNHNVLVFVLIHELAHVMSIKEGHGTEFMDNFRFILRESVKNNIYYPVDYSKMPMNYCGVDVTHNPYYNHK